VNEGLLQDVRDIKEMLVNMQRLESARVEREGVMLKDVESLKHTVDGNSKLGLKTEMQLLKNKVNGVYWLGGVVIVATISNIIAIFFGR